MEQLPSAPVPCLKTLFFMGKLKDLLDKAWDVPQTRLSAHEVPWVIGALVFLGRADEAISLAAKWKWNHTSPAKFDTLPEIFHLVCTRFFVGWAHTRGSRYAQARAFFASNLNLLRVPCLTSLGTAQRDSDEAAFIRFFAWQGIAFFYQLSGRYLKSFKACEKSFDAAISANHPWARLLAADLKSHMLIRLGRVSEGIKLLEWTLRHAQIHGFEGAKRAIRISALNYKAQFGLEPSTGLDSLLELLNSFSPEDCYSRSSLQMEIARQALLRGKGHLALKHLQEAESFIEAHGQPRNKCTLWQRRAWYHYLEGSFDLSLSCLDKAEKTLDPQMDLSFKVEILGLKWKCRLGQHRCKQIPASQKETQLTGHRWQDLQLIHKLSQKTGSAVHQNLLNRSFQRESERSVSDKARLSDGLSLSHDDPLGSLLDYVEVYLSKIKKQEHASQLKHFLIQEIIKTGYYFLFPKIFQIPPGQCCILFQVTQEGAMVVCNGPNVIFTSRGSSQSLRILATELAKKPLNKQEILQLVWGYRYDPMRHDNLVYAIIKRLKKNLGEADSLLQTKQGKYSFRAPVSILVNESEFLPMAPSGPATSSDPASDPQWKELNHRQVCILEWISLQSVVTVPQILKKWPISKATANRDLSHLESKGYIVAMGKARATSYCLAPSQTF